MRKTTALKRHRGFIAKLAHFNVAWNLLLFALNPAWGSIVLAWVWMAVAAYLTIGMIIERRRLRSVDARHEFLRRPQPKLPDPFRRSERIKALQIQVARLAPQIDELRRSVMLEAGERVVALPHEKCSHWPRDEVKLADGTTVAYICRRCDHDWANESWVASGAAVERQEHEPQAHSGVPK